MNKITLETLESPKEWVLIGQGHFGEVFKVKDKVRKIQVAVKKLKGNVSQCFTELRQEAEKLKSAATNFYVIQLVGIIESPPCIVMELMENGSLGTLLENVKDIPWALKYRILHEVAIGMNWLHNCSMLHLDLKPKNVLLNDSLHIRITDFGLSKYISTVDAEGDSEGIGGTLEYMPPEAFQEGYRPSKSTDIYSFAILSAVVLRNEEPYTVQNTTLISLHVSQGQRPSFGSLENTDAVKNLDKAIALCKQCWHNDIHERPPFDECCTQWEIIKSGYKDNEIKDAAWKVQRMMDCRDSTGSTSDISQTESSVSVNTRDMSEAIRKFHTMTISERPPVKQKSVPTTNPSSNNLRFPVQNSSQINQRRSAWDPRTYGQRTERMPVHPVQNLNYTPGLPTANMGQAHDFIKMTQTPLPGMGIPEYTAGYNYYRPPYFPPYAHTMKPNFPYSPANTISIDGSTTSLQAGNNNRMVVMGEHSNRGTVPSIPPWLHSPAASTGYPRQPQSFHMTIHGNVEGLQVGDNNEMFVMGASQPTSLNSRPAPPYLGQRVQPNIPSPPPTTASQVKASTQAGEAASLNTQTNQTTPERATGVNPSLGRPKITNVDNTETEHAATAKPQQETQAN